MAEDKNEASNSGQSEKDKTKENSKKLIQGAEKGAAMYFGGAAGSQALNAAKNSPIGGAIDKVEDKAAEGLSKAMDKNPALKHMVNKAGDSGALDAANKGLDAAGSMGAGGGGAAGAGGAAGGSSSMPSSFGPSSEFGKQSVLNDGQQGASGDASSQMMSKMTGGGGGSSSSSGGSASGQAGADADVSGTSSSAANSIFDFIKKHKFELIGAVAVAFMFILVIIVVLAIFVAPLSAVIGKIKGWFDGFVDKWDREAEEQYYETLKEVQEKINERYKVCIDVNLVTATLFVDRQKNEYNVQGAEDVAGEAEFDRAYYKKATKEIELLSLMQIKRQWKSYSTYEGGQGGACWPPDSPDECVKGGLAIKATAENEHCGFGPSFYNTLFLEGTDSVSKAKFRDSSNLRLVSRNDVSKTFAFTIDSKIAKSEKNYEYFLYFPDYDWIDYNKDGVQQEEELKCNPVEPYEAAIVLANNDINEAPYEAELSIEREEVFWWNIYESFVGDYYADFLPPEEVDDKGAPVGKYAEAIEKIVKDVYLTYKDMGPSHYCTESNTYCRTDTAPGTGGGTGGGTPNPTRQGFIDSISQLAVDEMSRTGVLASVTIAQAVLESRNGASGLSTKYANYFGMTGGSCTKNADLSRSILAPGEGGNNCSPNAYWSGTIVRMCNSSGGDCQWYRAYDTMENSFKDHSRLLATDLYGVAGITDYRTVTAMIGGKYATDGSYEQKLNEMIETYNLTQFDIGTWDGVAPTVPDTPQYTMCNDVVGGTGGTQPGTSPGYSTGGSTCKDGLGSSSSPYWSSLNSFNSPQCTWYAYGRAIKALVDSGLTKQQATKLMYTALDRANLHGDAGNWYNLNASTKTFDATTNVNVPRAGSIIVWTQQGYHGHVAFIESVNYNSDGSVKSLNITEGNVSYNGTTLKCYARTVGLDYVTEHYSSKRSSPYKFAGYIHLFGN